jgi:hypothetical protein
MTCPKCGNDYQSESGRCPFCSASLVIQSQTERPDDSRMAVAPKISGICPDCGTEQVGTVYRISSVMAAFLKPKYQDTFVPDRHRCVRKSVAG